MLCGRCFVCVTFHTCAHISTTQLDAGLFARDGRWNCARFYTMALGGGAAELFFMDTSPFVLKYQQRPWARFHGVQPPPHFQPAKPICAAVTGGVLSQSWESQLRELETRLARSQAVWKVLVAHHPVRSNGEHGDTKVTPAA